MENLRFGPATASKRHRWVEVEGDFEVVVTKLESAIKAEHFLLLHVIDTQRIMATAACSITPLRQFLFFHPTLMKRVLETDPGAIAELPLKIVALQLSARKVRLIAPRPELLLEEHPGLRGLAKELSTRVDWVLAACATPAR